MKLEVQYREEDLQEANRSALPPAPKASTARTIIVSVVYLALIACVSWLQRITKLNAGAPASPEPVQDLVIVLLPSVTVAVIVLLVMIGTMAGQVRLTRMRADFGTAAYENVKRQAVWLVILVLAAVIGAMIVLRNLPEVQWRTGRWAAIPVAFLPWAVALTLLPIIFTQYQKAMVRSAWLQKPSLHRPNVLELTDEQVVSSDEHCVSTYKWGAFLRFRETENLFILVTKDAMMLIVPKRHLAEEQTMIEFRARIQTHIKEGYFLTTPARAFEVLPPPIAVNPQEEHGHPGTAAHATQTEKA